MYAQGESREPGLGIAPAIVGTVVAKAVPLVASLFKGSTEDRDKAFNKEAYALARSGDWLALRYLAARGDVTPGFTMPADLAISDPEARAGKRIAPGWANRNGRNDAKDKYNAAAKLVDPRLSGTERHDLLKAMTEPQAIPSSVQSGMPALPALAGVNPVMLAVAGLSVVMLSSLWKRR